MHLMKRVTNNSINNYIHILNKAILLHTGKTNTFSFNIFKKKERTTLLFCSFARQSEE